MNVLVSETQLRRLANEHKCHLSAAIDGRIFFQVQYIQPTENKFGHNRRLLACHSVYVHCQSFFLLLPLFSSPQMSIVCQQVFIV